MNEQQYGGRELPGEGKLCRRFKSKSPISELIETIIIVVAGVTAGILVWDSIAFGIWLGMAGACIKIITSYITAAVDLLILVVKKLELIENIKIGDVQNYVKDVADKYVKEETL